MLTIEHLPDFLRKIERIKDNGLKERVKHRHSTSLMTGGSLRKPREGGMPSVLKNRVGHFERLCKACRRSIDRRFLTKQVAKIIAFPESGKPMRYSRKGTREVYVPPFRISYAYLAQENKIVFLDLYHKDEQ